MDSYGFGARGLIREKKVLRNYVIDQVLTY